MLSRARFAVRWTRNGQPNDKRVMRSARSDDLQTVPIFSFSFCLSRRLFAQLKPKQTFPVTGCRPVDVVPFLLLFVTLHNPKVCVCVCVPPSTL